MDWENSRRGEWSFWASLQYFIGCDMWRSHGEKYTVGSLRNHAKSISPVENAGNKSHDFTGVGFYVPLCFTSPKHWGYFISNRYLKVFKIPKKGHLPTPGLVVQDFDSTECWILMGCLIGIWIHKQHSISISNLDEPDNCCKSGGYPDNFSILTGKLMLPIATSVNFTVPHFQTCTISFKDSMTLK